MAAHGDEHGPSGHRRHGANGTGAWIDKHLGGAVMSFGVRLEMVIESTMFLIVNGFMLRAGIVFLAIMTPVILVELALHLLRL